MKLKKLMPIVALSGMATVVTPIITSCSLHNDIPDVISLEWNSQEYCFFSKTYSFKKDTIYTAKADWKDCGLTGYWNWAFAIGNKAKEEYYKFSATNAKFWLDNVEYTLEQESEEFQFYDGIFQGTHTTTFTSETHFKFQFQVEKDVEASLSFEGIMG